MGKFKGLLEDYFKAMIMVVLALVGAYWLLGFIHSRVPAAANIASTIASHANGHAEGF
jgi:hypothetical protein